MIFKTAALIIVILSCSLFTLTASGQEQELKIVLGKSNGELGLRVPSAGDGINVPVVIDGISARHAANLNSRYMYVVIDHPDSIIQSCDVYVIVEVSGENSQALKIQYDKNSPNPTLSTKYTVADQPITLAASNQWKKLCFFLPALRLAHGENLGADFRFVADDVAVHSIEVTTRKPSGFDSTSENVQPSGVTQVNLSPNAITVFDVSDLLNLDLNNDQQRHLFWDEMHLVAALEGLVNRDRPRLFIRYLKDPDDFWWQQMIQPGGWLAGRQIVHVKTLDELLTRFHSFYSGSVVWDERVPATSNLASTIAGCDNVLPLRFDPRTDSLYHRLTPDTVPVKAALLRKNGSPLFTGTGLIPGTNMPSSGSAKCDAYFWLIKNYLATGKANPLCMGYYLDAFWLNCWKASSPENNTLCNQDFVIARRGVMFDLNVWDDESPVDDPQQRPGTDAATLRSLLRAAYDRFGGNGVIHVAGFVPWAFKYSDFQNATWSAGSHHKGVSTEWQYAKTLSCFNAYMDADALGFSAMSNASFYQHYPLATHYSQNPKPTGATLAAEGLLDGQGCVVPRTYVAFYVGDYDSAAWLYHKLPTMWADPARGTIPLSWAFNPNLCERFPLGMVWSRQRQTNNDWFVAGDSGAGYLNPGYLTPPRPLSGLPSGLLPWEQHCDRFYKQWDLSLTGFVLDGFAPGLSGPGLDAYSRFSPDGIVALKIPTQGIHNGMPFLRINADIVGNPSAAAATIMQHVGVGTPSFAVFRSILKTPTWHAQVQQELSRIAGGRIKVVDMYTLLQLVRQHEANVAVRPLPTRDKVVPAQQTLPGMLRKLF